MSRSLEMDGSPDPKVHRLGIDIGTRYVKVVVTNGGPQPETAMFEPHYGKPDEVVDELVNQDLKNLPTGLTGSLAHTVQDKINVRAVHPVQAEIRAVNARFPGVRNILNIGGGSCTLIRQDDDGNFVNYTTNSLCAAGTGSFLDEQAGRLGVDYDDLESYPVVDDPPSVATRCAVFAKSDLIHRQQEGYSKPALWSGLCRGCVETMLTTLLKGRPLEGRTIVTGGVTLNPHVMRWLQSNNGTEMIAWDDAHLSGALGAALLARENETALEDLPGTERIDITERGLPLVLKRSQYPSFEVFKEYVDDIDNEVRLWKEPQKHVAGYLGIDVGSTSTKLAFIDSKGGVIFDVYRKTLGEPIAATQKILKASAELMQSEGFIAEVLGCGTTGSGRKLVGHVVGADLVLNEISAHVAGATFESKDIETIFEIGGQDAKYMRVLNGGIRDANMNYVCAAGTGSFIEEQANKLGYKVQEVGPMVEGISPPQTSDRCTVFMEEDINALLRRGFGRDEAMAAVMYSVAKNYLNKVVGNRQVSRKKVFFQGATARNRGLVAAFENLMGLEIVVSPCCHVMGAFGVALEVQNRTKVGKSTFRGFDLYNRKIELTTETCENCQNRCTITFAQIEGDSYRPSWGYMCGKEPDESRKRVSKTYRLFNKREALLKKIVADQSTAENAPTVQMARCLSAHAYAPFWAGLMGALGYRLELGPVTGEAQKNKGIQFTPGDYCFPVKAAIGHQVALAVQEGDDPILIPQMISAQLTEHTTNSLFCPYLQSHAAVTKATLEANGISSARILDPLFDLRWDDKQMAKALSESLGTRLGAGERKLHDALKAARNAQDEFERACENEGVKALQELERSGEKGVVIIGRPYNSFDPGVNVDLPRKISDLGLTVIPLDFMPFKPELLEDGYSNIYWALGQRIISALKQIENSTNLFAVYLTNFSCGPDSFLLSYAERIMGERPLLILELDEHGADAGYLTRVEAFKDVIGSYVHDAKPRETARHSSSPPLDPSRKVWLPPMHPIGGRLLASILRAYGYPAEMLPMEDREAFEIGRKATRGSECLPTAVTIGTLLKKMREIDAKPQEHTFFMPTATGPCRFGQYATLHRMVIDDAGYQGLEILSPSSVNSYQGMPEAMRRRMWLATLTSDILFKMLCRVRPYENINGTADAVCEEHIRNLERVFENGADPRPAVRFAVQDFAKVPRTADPKPLVGIVGEIYVRCNPFSNGYVIEHIERYGGEAWLSPLAEWFLYIAYLQENSATHRMEKLSDRVKSVIKNRFMSRQEHEMAALADAVLHDRHEPSIEEVVRLGTRRLPLNFEGESVLTVGRAEAFAKQGADAVVNCAPFGCMPGTITASLMQELQQQTGVPMVSMYYDGVGEINGPLEVFIREAAAKL